MSITKPPTKKTHPSPNLAKQDQIATYINQAPDAQASNTSPPLLTVSGIKTGKQLQVSIAMPPELLQRIEHRSKELSITRAAFIKMAVTKALEAENS
jgi:hypothetical protein